MENDLRIIDQFLRDFSPEIAGRSAGELTPEIENRLVKLAEGGLGDDERHELCKEILGNEKAFRFLLNQLRKGDGDA